MIFRFLGEDFDFSALVYNKNYLSYISFGSQTLQKKALTMFNIAIIKRMLKIFYFD